MGILITILVFLLIFGLLWYLVNLLPVDPKIKQLAQIILIIIAILYLLGGVGVYGGWAWKR